MSTFTLQRYHELREGIAREEQALNDLLDKADLRLVDERKQQYEAEKASLQRQMDSLQEKYFPQGDGYSQLLQDLNKTL